LTLGSDEPHSKFAFKFNLRRYDEDEKDDDDDEGGEDKLDPFDDDVVFNADGRGLHSSTSQLNISALSGIKGILGVLRECLGRGWWGI